MVNKLELETALHNQLTLFNKALDKTLDDKLAKMKKEIIDKIKKDIKDKIRIEIKAEIVEKEIDLEKIIQRNLQYEMNTNVVITCLPIEVNHDSLEHIIIEIFNKVCLQQITSRDIVAVHGISTNNI